MRSDADIEEAIDRYGDAVLRACSAYLPSRHDAEDAFQDTFIKYANHESAFTDETHRKAWLIHVAGNVCKDRLRISQRMVPLDEKEEEAVESDDGKIAERMRVRDAMKLLTDDQRLALMLSAVEGYPVPEIAEIMGKPPNTVYSYITRGKRKLKEVLGNDGS